MLKGWHARCGGTVWDDTHTVGTQSWWHKAVEALYGMTYAIEVMYGMTSTLLGHRTAGHESCRNTLWDDIFYSKGTVYGMKCTLRHKWDDKHDVDAQFGMTRAKIKSREKSENGRQSRDSRRLNMANTLLSNKKILRKKKRVEVWNLERAMGTKGGSTLSCVSVRELGGRDGERR
jgi:hypothetical protein